jgi:hypothetical protein
MLYTADKKGTEYHERRHPRSKAGVGKRAVQYAFSLPHRGRSNPKFQASIAGTQESKTEARTWRVLEARAGVVLHGEEELRQVHLGEQVRLRGGDAELLVQRVQQRHCPQKAQQEEVQTRNQASIMHVEELLRCFASSN